MKEDCYWYDEWQDMNARIPFCKLDKPDVYRESCEGCTEYHSKYKRTNADKLRSMSDKELAKWLSRHLAVMTRYSEHPKRTVLWLDWLKQEVAD